MKFSIRQSYFNIGIISIASGSVISLLFYFVKPSVPLTALGLACVILGFTSLTLPKELNASRAMISIFQSATLSTESILRKAIELKPDAIRYLSKEKPVLGLDALTEGLDLRKCAIYLPTKDGLVVVYLPLGNEFDLSNIDNIQSLLKLPSPLPSNTGILVYPIGSDLNLIDLDPELSLEQALRYFLIEVCQLCSSLRSSSIGNVIVLEIENIKVKSKAAMYSSILGTIPTSLAACIICMIKKKPIIVLDEQLKGSRLLSRFSAVKFE